MSRARATVPTLVLGTTSLELPAQTTRDRALEVAGRFREPESLAVTLVKALDSGAQAIYATPSPTMRAALAELRRPVPVLARLPFTPPDADLHEAHLLARSAEEPAMGVALALVRSALTTMAMLPAALTGDLAARVAWRCEREAPALGARVISGLAVASPITDLALAAGHARFFERVLRYGRGRFGGLAGFETHNLARLLERLREWGIAPDFVIGAMNPRGFGMRPDAAAVEAAVRHEWHVDGTGIPVIACDLRAGGTVALAEGAAYARAHGAHGVLPDLVDLDEVASELRALAR